MEKVVHNIFRILSFVLIGAALVLLILVWAKGDTALKNDLSLQNNIMNPFTWLTYIAFGITFVLAVVFPIYQVIVNPRNAMRALIVLGLLLVIAVISYLVASNSLDGEVLQKVYRKGELTAAGSKRVGTALIGTYILGVLAVVAVFYSAVASLFKK